MPLPDVCRHKVVCRRSHVTFAQTILDTVPMHHTPDASTSEGEHIEDKMRTSKSSNRPEVPKQSLDKVVVS